VESLFSSRQEVHATELGVLSGVILFGLYYMGYERSAVAASIGLLLFALGIPHQLGDIQTNCAVCGSKVVQAKPWYYLSGFVFSGVLGFTSRFVRAPGPRDAQKGD
jgi:hypothetical protein